MVVRMFSDDLALTRAALGGDERAGHELARRLRCVPRVIVLLGRKAGLLLRPDEVDDLSQDTQLRVMEKLGEFGGRAKLETWVYRFCHFEIFNYRRKLGRLPKTITDLGDAEIPEPEAAAELPASSSINGLLKHLSPREAQVVRLRHVEDLTLREIHEQTGMGLSTVKTCYYRGREKLREVLATGQIGEAL